MRAAFGAIPLNFARTHLQDTRVSSTLANKLERDFTRTPHEVLSPRTATPRGLGYAVISGAVTSGLGYAVWYRALGGLTTSRAALCQLAVPVIAALAGGLFLSEELTWRLSISTTVILGSLAFGLRKD